ncbi:hypothetical protein KSS87_020860 [Heliosperma pusillum]|nr:hypothetical protein KSS87_014467 [Heliosperma pusillum]KAH9618829.1 hypothetical protein KSS87_020860 [Heliosperma pusillum]
MLASSSQVEHVISQSAAPLDLQCKDKFLVQSIVVPSETVDEDLTSDMFSRDPGRQMEEKKLRVILVYSQPPEHVSDNEIASQDPSYDIIKDKVPTGAENLPSSNKIAPEPDEAKYTMSREELRLARDSDTILPEGTRELESINAKEVRKLEAMIITKNETEDLLKKELEEYRTKLDVLDSKLAEAEQTAMKLTNERTKALQEKGMVKRELALINRRLSGKTVHLGFPLLHLIKRRLKGEDDYGFW